MARFVGFFEECRVSWSLSLSRRKMKINPVNTKSKGSKICLELSSIPTTCTCVDDGTNLS